MKNKLLIIYISFILFSANAGTLVNIAVPLKSDFDRSYVSKLNIEYQSLLKEPTLLNDYISRENDDEFQNVFKMYINSLENRSIELLKPFIRSHKNNLGPQKIFKIIQRNYHLMKQKYKKIYIWEKISGDNQQAFIWGIKDNNSNLIIVGSLFVKQENRIFWHWDWNQKESLDLFCEIIRRKPDFVQEKADYSEKVDSSKYTVTLKDSTASKMLHLKFNGKKYDYLELSNITKSNDKIIALYKKLEVNLSNSNSNYGDFYTSKSALKLKAQLDKFPFMRGVIIKKNHNKIINFVMDAFPFYIVFYKEKNDTCKYFSSYDYILSTKDGFKFTNYGYHDAFDQILHNNISEIQKTIYSK